MSKAVKLSFAILVLLLLFSLAFAGYAFLEKQKIEKQKNDLVSEVGILKAREEKYAADNTKIQEQLKAIEGEKNKIQADFTAVNERVAKADEELKKITQERDEWKARIEAIQKERDELAVKLKEQSSAPVPEPQIVYKYIERPVEEKPKEEPAPAEAKKETQTVDETAYDNMGDSYWADVLKQKAQLEVEVNNLHKEVSASAVEIAELKKENNDLQLEMGKLKNEKEFIEREIKNGKDLADALSMELARVKGDNKYSSERTAKLMEESDALRDQIKGLTSTKIALEKTIVRISEEKKDLERKLTDTERMVENKISEIWDIKESLNKQVKDLAMSTKEIELPPIVVSAGRPSAPEQEQKAAAVQVGLAGNVVSVNEENNFIIIDKGQGSGIAIGNKLNIYRDKDYIAQVEVIQVRPDIAAADIKEKKSKIKVGDIVR